MSSSNEHEGDNVDSSDLELMTMREKLIKMQEDAKKLKLLQSQQLALLQETASIKKAAEKQQNDPESSDNKSIHVANVHFSATEKQLSEHFSICGKVQRTTILKDAFTGHPKGFAYLQFEEPNSVSMALAFNGTTFCSRIIKVTKKSNEAAAKVIVAAPYRRPARSFPPPRFPGGRFSSRYASSGAYRPRGRAMGARNKKWVKPGLLST
uniref:RRM domain-containing protein n=1 Tax=Ciona savignyi TaxID=51511 RepID=H2YXV1_CIOSA